jgi:predicted nucleic acid-binding protein
MVRALFDTNILIDYLNGISQAKVEIERYEQRYISIITFMEVLVGAEPELEVPIRSWLSGFEVVHLGVAIAEGAISIRQKKRIKLPDAIVWASAQTNNALLVTRNTKDFPASEPGVRVPYHV